MENAVHDDLAWSDLVEDGVRKPPNERSTHRWIDEREGLWMPLDRPEAGSTAARKAAARVGAWLWYQR